MKELMKDREFLEMYGHHMVLIDKELRTLWRVIFGLACVVGLFVLNLVL